MPIQLVYRPEHLARLVNDMATDFVFVFNTVAVEKKTNPMSGLQSRVGRLYLLDNLPDGWLFMEKCCATKARRFKLGLSIDDFNIKIKQLKFGQIEYF